MSIEIDIYKKIHAIISELKGISENGYNAYHKYKYIKQEDIINAIKPLLLKHQLVITSEVKEEEIKVIEDKGIYCSVTMMFTITDLESHGQMEFTYKGHGIDVGDKAIYKAMTGAEKYFYMKNFLIGAGNDDPEYNGCDDYDTSVIGSGRNKQSNSRNNNSRITSNYNNRNNYSDSNQNANNNNNNTGNYNSINTSQQSKTIGNTNKDNNNSRGDNGQVVTAVPIEMILDDNYGKTETIQKSKEENKNLQENGEERTIDLRLQKLLFVAANQEKQIVLNAIQKLGYTSTDKVKISEYKRVLELIKAQVKLLR